MKAVDSLSRNWYLWDHMDRSLSAWLAQISDVTLVEPSMIMEMKGKEDLPRLGHWDTWQTLHGPPQPASY